MISMIPATKKSLDIIRFWDDPKNHHLKSKPYILHFFIFFWRLQGWHFLWCNWVNQKYKLKNNKIKAFSVPLKRNVDILKTWKQWNVVRLPLFKETNKKDIKFNLFIDLLSKQHFWISANIALTQSTLWRKMMRNNFKLYLTYSSFSRGEYF